MQPVRQHWPRGFRSLTRISLAMETKNDSPLKNEGNDRVEQPRITEHIVSIQALSKLFEAADAWSHEEMDTVVSQLAIDAGFSRENVAVAAELAQTRLDRCSEAHATLELEADRPVTDGGGIPDLKPETVDDLTIEYEMRSGPQYRMQFEETDTGAIVLSESRRHQGTHTHSWIPTGTVELSDLKVRQ